MFLDFLAKQSLHASEESPCSSSRAEVTVKGITSGLVRIALHNVRRLRDECQARIGSTWRRAVPLIRAIEGGKHGKDVQKEDEEGQWEEDRH